MAERLRDGVQIRPAWFDSRSGLHIRQNRDALNVWRSLTPLNAGIETEIDWPPDRQRRNGPGRSQSRATWKPANDWLTGISSSALMFRCAGRVATQNRVSAMSSPVIGAAPP